MTIPAECKATEFTDGTWYCQQCHEVWPSKPAECAKQVTLYVGNQPDFPIQVKKKANLYLDRLERRAPHLRSIIHAENNRQVLRGVLCELIEALVGECVPYEGEPSFNLLARDPQAPYLVDDWAFERAELDPQHHKEKVANAFDRASAMRDWKEAHPDLSLPTYDRQPHIRDLPKDLMLRIDRVIRAPENVWAAGDYRSLLGECHRWFAALAPVKANAGQLAKGSGAEPDPSPTTLTAPRMMPVDNYSPAQVLRMFRAFVIRNVTQWVAGAGDHHHPIWEQVELNVEGDDATSGPEYVYIQPLNRKKLVLLRLEAEEAGEQDT